MRTSWAFALVGICAASSPASAQLRGTAVFMEPSFGYDGRAGVDVGYGGSGDEGIAVAATGAYQFRIGNCSRVVAGLGAGVFDPEAEDDDGGQGDDLDSGANLGGTGWVRLNPCPDPLSDPRFLFWIFTGAGSTWVGDASAQSASIGLAATYRIDLLPFIKLEPWVIPRLQHVEALDPDADSKTELAFSSGLTFGIGGTAGFRVGWDCCIGGGTELSWGLSVWF